MTLEIPAFTPYDSGVAGLAYNEPAFGHFLAIERRRAEHSSRSILLVLVSLRSQPGRNDVVTSTTAAALFVGLGSAVREVDFVGWYREGRIAAAVLAQRATLPDEAPKRIAARVARSLTGRTPDGVPVRVRVVCLRGTKSRA
jgi:hypothetical protein